MNVLLNVLFNSSLNWKPVQQIFWPSENVSLSLITSAVEGHPKFMCQSVKLPNEETNDSPWLQQFLSDIEFLESFDDHAWIRDIIVDDPMQLFQNKA